MSGRFNVQYAEEVYAQQPVHNSPGIWKCVRSISLSLGKFSDKAQSR